MKKTVFNGFWWLLVVGLATMVFDSCANNHDDPLRKDEGVVINGVKWATRNVDKPGTFTAKPEDAGMFYQWNRSVAWEATGVVIGWDETVPKGDTWEQSNDPSPVGWRLPTHDELMTLLDQFKVSHEWTTQNGINGRLFTDKATGNTLFLPAIGNRNCSDGSLDRAGLGGQYWSGTWGSSRNAYYIGIGNTTVVWGNNSRAFGFAVRPVAESVEDNQEATSGDGDFRDGLAVWETASSQEIREMYPTFGRVFDDKEAVVGEGCSWYCDGGPYRVTASSYLKSQNANITYFPDNAHDLSFETAWVEGVKGQGIGEYLTYYFKPTAPRITDIIIANGYVKSEKAYRDNSRVKRLKLYINDIPVAILNLEDVRQEQIFTFKPIGRRSENIPWSEVEKLPDWTLKFEILEVYPGDRYEDTAISEIYFDGLDVH
ncbi:MAG: hypothetical protein FWD56_02100 [Bacteroidales bacterium]|nr:hypothetical protein [Bacteroidales bacterium]